MGNFLQIALGKIIGTKNERELKRLQERVVAINALEPEMQALPDSEFPLRTEQFKQRVANGEPLDNLLPETFALCREAGRRTLNMRHFDVQHIGGMALHEGKIAEMKTGEGKTLVATLPAYLNALEGKGVHIVTVNDYLARRDAAWMGPIYRLLGMSVGVIVHDLDDEERRAAYRCDITYGTNNEFGFDYLRDNMKFDLADYVQREHNYAIVDEVDSILIDEARTPLIISGSSDESIDKYNRADKVIPRLQPTVDYEVDEKHRQATLTDSGNAKVEKALGLENLYDPANMDWIHGVQQALKAHTLFKRDRDYVVKDGEVIIVDEFTGRLMPGRRWSDGLHQAVEAKEGVKVEKENQTLATVTFQNYFRMYKKLAGMTGTAETEAAEFEKIYNLEIVVIPTNQTLIRHEYADIVYRTEREKFNAVVEEIKEYHLRGQPVLVGSIAIEKSEKLSAQLRKSGMLPVRLLELAKAAGLEGPKLHLWAERLVQDSLWAMEWLIRAGVTVAEVKALLKQGRYQALQRFEISDLKSQIGGGLASSSVAGTPQPPETAPPAQPDRHGTKPAGQQRAPLPGLRDRDARYGASSGDGTRRVFLEAILKRTPRGYPYGQPPAPDENVLPELLQLLRNTDEKTLPLVDYLIEVRCSPARLVEVLNLKEMKHNVLNAKQHEREAWIVAQAGRVGAVTVSTNMAGRGTDILLGGNPEFLAREEFRKAPEKYREQGIDPEPPERPPEGSAGEIFQKYVDDYAHWREQWNEFISRFKTVTDGEHEGVVGLGGLHILGTERHEARRIDNQLRGRAGRQGDPGSSRFYLSLEDDLLRIFAGERISSIMHKLGMEEGVPIESRMITRRIQAAQKAVEAQNFEARKHLLEYDDVMNKQRETVYGLRRQLLEGEDQKEYILDAADRVVNWLVRDFCPKDQHADQWNVKGLQAEFWGRFGIDLRGVELPLDPRRIDEIINILKDLVHKRYEEREQVWGSERMRTHERMIMLQVVDMLWKDHLLAMDHLKEGIGLRGYGQRDPLVEYKRESFDMFEQMMDRTEDETLRYLFLMKTPEEELAMIEEYKRRKRREQREMQMIGAGAVEKPQQVIRREKIGRNDPCPCGSGKKYKKCHGAAAAAAPPPKASSNA